MATLAVQNITTTGLAATYATATATTGDQFLAASGTFLHVKNANAGSVTCTLTTPTTVDGLALADRDIVIPTATDRFVAVPDWLYRDPTSGLATVVCTPAASVTIAVVRI